MKNVIIFLVCFAVCYSLLNSVAAEDEISVGLDYYYNNEWKLKDDKPVERFHYTWEDKTNTGYSELGAIFESHGAKLSSLENAPSTADLSKFDIYFIVDPDIPSENPKPNQIQKKAADNIEIWVRDGGILVLFANNDGQSEFEHLNMLASRFGIQFNGDTRNDSTPDNLKPASLEKLSEHSIFNTVSKLYIKGLSTLTVKSPARTVLTDSGDIIMAESSVGKGYVFALGDPWIYNEYIDIDGWDNRKAARNLVSLLMKKAGSDK